MSDFAAVQSPCAGLFLVRKPIFDREQQVWGHEVDVGESEVGSSADANNVNTCMLDEGVKLVEDDGGRIIITATPAMLADDTLLEMPADRTLIILSQDIIAGPGVIERLDAFHETGFALGVTVGARKPASKELVDAAEIVRVRLDGLLPKEIMAVVREVKPLGLPMLASGVDDWQTYEGTRALGFSQFQGRFFNQPKIEPGKKLSEASMAKIQLMQELMRPGCDLNELASIIARDSVLSYRLLKFINSASFSLVQKVASIQQAVAFLGLNQLKQWASFMVVAGLDESSKGEELSYSGLLRARFLEVCSGLSGGVPGQGEAMFMVGLFSRLDAMLGLPMREVLKGMPLDETIADGLLGNPGVIRTWLEMADAVEDSDWPRARTFMGDLGLDASKVAVEYLRAASWAGVRCNDQRQIS